MLIKNHIQVIRVENEAARAQAKSVLQATYQQEKNWVLDERKLISPEDLLDSKVSWFVVLVDELPVGVLRVLYNPPLDLYSAYGFKQIGGGLDVEAFLRGNRIAEIGRFAVLPEHRRNILVAAALMRAATEETVARDYTHYITDIFEGEKHSPYQFHTRVMGFQPVATHDIGELNCPNRRITMILDLQAAYQRLRATPSWLYRFLTENWSQQMHERLGGKIRSWNSREAAEVTLA